MTMLELCMACRNFHKPDILQGDYTISGGILEPLPEIPDGAWIRVVGSTFNDGVWQYPHGGFTDETFSGAVWILHIPPDFVSLLNDIVAWETANREAVDQATAEVLASPYTSETFAGYTYQRRSGIGDIPTTWDDPRLGFSARLKQWRKI